MTFFPHPTLSIREEKGCGSRVREERVEGLWMGCGGKNGGAVFGVE